MLGQNSSSWRASVAWFTGILLALLLSSCATMYGGTEQVIPFNSQPRGAEVWIDGKFIAKTPFEITLRRGGRYEVVLRLGEQEKSVILERGINSASFLGLVPGSAAMAASYVLIDQDQSGLGAVIIGMPLFVVGAVSAAAPLVIDIATGAVFQISPGEVFVEFE